MIKSTSQLKTFLHRPSSYVIHLVDFSFPDQLQGHYPHDTEKWLGALIKQLLLFFALIKHDEKLVLNLSFESTQHLIILELYPDGHYRFLCTPNQALVYPSPGAVNAKLNKFSAQKNIPYSSFVKIPANLHNFAQEILNNSYQLNGYFFTSESSNKSALILNPPKISSTLNDQSLAENLPIQDFLKIINFDSTDVSFTQIPDMVLLKSTDLFFSCPCTNQYYMNKLSVLNTETLNDLFQGPNLEITCDFCFKAYKLKRDDLLKKS